MRNTLSIFPALAIAISAGLGVMTTAGCQPCELPVSVYVPDGYGWNEEGVTAEWSADDGATWTDCEAGTGDNIWQCGPDDASYEGPVDVRVTSGDAVLEGSVDVVADDSCLAQTDLDLTEPETDDEA